ncbi:uncharacterized protein LOC132303516 [Cornus florida]|uniref:uncharacterized protein LOC132303516 n=1 Tax=Cornus florida TaxID=4283 RepID=UPI0028981ABB|nr:uncharacterized protein LOC132303516 [Cornus florida]
MATFFMEILDSSHTYATGGTSVDEFWADPMRLGDTLGRENEESCATHNMLKGFLDNLSTGYPYAVDVPRLLVTMDGEQSSILFGAAMGQKGASQSSYLGLT